MPRLPDGEVHIISEVVMTLTEDRASSVTRPTRPSSTRRGPPSLVELLRRNALRADSERRVSEENIQALADAGLFSIATPSAWGATRPTSGPFSR